MKIVHTGDWHLKIPEKHERWYLDRAAKFLSKLLDEGASELIITGDIFDRTPTALEIGLLLGFLESVSCPIYIVAGNHDRNKKKAIRADYLKCILQFYNSNRIVWATDDIVQTKHYTLVPNYILRQGTKIPDGDGKKWLLSHIRHKIKYSRAEYDLESIKGYELVLLSDIHTTFKYSDRIYYSMSPYRTTKKTILDLEDIDNNGFGYNVIDTQSHITHKEIWLPNHYVLKANEKIGEINTENLIDVEYQIKYDQINEYEGENVVITRDNMDIDLQNNIYEVIEEILVKDFKISSPGNYIDLLVRIVGELNVT
jgi:predicted phosphodiesterase